MEHIENNSPLEKDKEEEILRQKIEVIEKIPTGVSPIAETILVLLGEKPAVELYLPNKSDALDVVESLRSIGLFAEISEKSREYHNPDSTDILVARSQETLNELKLADSGEDHRKYGELMGYPLSAIDAFFGENGAERLPREEQDNLTESLAHTFAGSFIFSKHNTDEELALVTRRLKLLAQKAPGLFYRLFPKEKAAEYIRELIEDNTSFEKKWERKKEEVMGQLIGKYGQEAEKEREMISVWILKLERAFGALEKIKEKRILDLGCGSNPPEFSDSSYKPWFPRLLHELGAHPVGIDIGNLEGEEFEHYSLDLSKKGVLDFLPSKSFDGVYCAQLFTSPKLEGMTEKKQRQEMLEEIENQIDRLLKEDGVIISFDPTIDSD